VVLLEYLLTWITTDYDGEEVQPHGQDEIGSPSLLFLFFYLSRLACCQAELARRTGLHTPHCKDTNVQKHTLKKEVEYTV
jgi:hypothetical protein